MRRWIARWCLLALSLLSLIRAAADPVLEWNDLMLDAIRIDNSGPTLSTRNLAILHGAIYDAVNSVSRRHQPYLGYQEAAGPVLAEAAAAAAGYEIMTALYPGLKARSDELREVQIRQFPQADVTTNGLALGRAAAIALLQARVGDGANTQVPYIPSSAPGQWRRTAPFFRPPLDPHWRYVRLFCLPTKEPFVVPPPPPMESAEYAQAWDEVRILGATDSPERTAYESETAIFWSDFSYTAMPPGHWHEIVAVLARREGGTLEENARLLALVSLAQADAAIVCWEGKFRYNFWRPETAIARANEDGNGNTAPDPNWIPWLIAPNFPEYPSGHSTFSKASATVLSLYYGTDRMAFTATSDSVPGVVRSYESFAQCADEVGLSRIYGGIHFEFANREGKRSGDRIARFVFGNYLLANDSLPRLTVETPAPGSVRFRVHGHVGSTCVVEASDDLDAWREIGSGAAVPGGFLTDTGEASGPARFYRVREL